MKPTILSVCVWAIIVHALAVIDVFVFGTSAIFVEDWILDLFICGIF
jgi:hypothetical protein